MSAAAEYKFEGWMGLDLDSAKGNMVWQEFPEVKPFEETDVDIQITHCGICGSDLHNLRSGWFPTPYVSGHSPISYSIVCLFKL
jgi:alcohol dehydrogenase (NADP+)